MHEKFMHRETTISREIKLLKNKFDLLEKSRQFRSILQKSNNNNLNLTSDNNEDLLSASDLNESQRMKSEATSEAGSFQADAKRAGPSKQTKGSSPKNVRIRLPALQSISKFLAPLLKLKRPDGRLRRKSNRVSSLASMNPSIETHVELTDEANNAGQESVTTNATGMAAVKKEKRKEGFFRNLFR